MARATRVPRVGILVECGRDGLEFHFCRRICSLLREQHGARFEERIIPMDNKPRLLLEAATVVDALLAEGFDRVVILWDEEPSWPDKHEPLCWHHEKEHLSASLHAQGLDIGLVQLVCIERAFESWLMFDGDLLSRFLSTPAHAVRVGVPKNPHRLRNAKGVMIKLFRQHHRTYVDVIMAPRLSMHLENLSRLRRCETFVRFAAKVIGRAL
jgi:hypothetical protein